MLKNIMAIALCAGIALSQAGCSTLADAKAAKGSGEARVYDKPLDTVWNTTIEVIKGTDLQIVSEEKSNGTILAQRAMTAFSYGENVAVFISEENGQTSTRVEVVNKRSLSTNITAANWAHTILKELDKKLGPGKEVK